MLAESRSTTKPKVFVTETDYERLWNLAGDSSAPGARLLRQELERATVVKDTPARSDFVRVNSTVEFADLVTGRVRRVVLVEPQDADIDADRLSILSPAGAALLGLRAGDAFAWTTADGRARALVVNRVVAEAPSRAIPAAASAVGGPSQ